MLHVCNLAFDFFSTKGDVAMDRHTMYAGVSVVLAGLLGFSWARGGGALNADEAKANDRDIAVVDMNKIFANHKGLQAKNEELQREGLVAQEKGKILIETAKQLQDDLKRHKQGTAEFDRISKELQAKADAWKKLAEETQKHVQEQNLANLLSVYQLINEEIQRIAEARHFRLVINFTSEPVEQKDPAKAALILNRQILYQNGLDITEEVIQAVN
jgi:Skp family chaperone for outer membrane proteins